MTGGQNLPGSRTPLGRHRLELLKHLFSEQLVYAPADDNNNDRHCSADALYHPGVSHFKPIIIVRTGYCEDSACVGTLHNLIPPFFLPLLDDPLLMI